MTTTSQVTGEERLLIGGELRTARSGKVFDVVNPATEEVIGVVADAGAEDRRNAPLKTPMPQRAAKSRCADRLANRMRADASSRITACGDRSSDSVSSAIRPR